MSTCSGACTSQLKALPVAPQTLSFGVPWLLTKLETWPVSRGSRQILEAKVDSGRGTECLAQPGRALTGKNSAGCPASRPRGFHLLFWLRSTTSVNSLPLSLISFLETQPVFPPRFSPCRDKVVRGGSGLKDQNGSFLSPLQGRADSMWSSESGDSPL